MWKHFFNFMDFLACLVPIPPVRRWLRNRKLFSYAAKRDALRAAYPDLDWRHMKLAKGGHSLAFILNNKYVFKIRKNHHHYPTDENFIREKRITDAIADVIGTRVPKMELIQVGDFLVYKTQFIPGRMLIDMPLKRIREHREKIAKQLGTIIYNLHNAELPELADMRAEQNATGPDIGMTHGDMCSNVVIDPNTMDVVGIIDWEYANFSSLKNEIIGLSRTRRKMRLTDIAPLTMWNYYNLTTGCTKK